MKPWRRVIGVLITFHLVCFGWILFRADSMQTVGEVLTQIFTNFHPEVFMQFVVGYKGVFVLMVVGYILHFMPKSAENGLQAVVTRSPLPGCNHLSTSSSDIVSCHIGNPMEAEFNNKSPSGAGRAFVIKCRRDQSPACGSNVPFSQPFVCSRFGLLLISLRFIGRK